MVVTTTQHSPLSTKNSALSTRHSALSTLCSGLLSLLVLSYNVAVNLLLLFLDYNIVNLDLVCELHSEYSRQFVASVLGISLVVGILGNF